MHRSSFIAKEHCMAGFRAARQRADADRRFDASAGFMNPMRAAGSSIERASSELTCPSEFVTNTRSPMTVDWP
jgi:hypothetical protein